MSTITVDFQTLPAGQGLAPPAQATSGAAGADLVSAEDMTIAPGGVHAIATGIALAIPQGFEGQVRPRSGLALKHGVTVLNAPGTIDCDYRGEVRVILINHGKSAYTVCRGDRIAQLVIAPVVHASFQSVSALDETHRGSGGFGSTGMSVKKGV